ncbi:MAG: glycosyltransferase family 2 protein [Pseudomonadota bacterium]
MHDLVVSIINYRTRALTLDCLRSVLADIAGADVRVVVTDNASGDNSAEEIAAWCTAHPDAPVTLVQSQTNSGFSGGHNQGMAALEARHYLLLNSDALLRPGFIATILAAARGNPRAGFIAPRIEHEDGTGQISCFRAHGPVSELIRGAASDPVTRLLKARDVPLSLDPAPGTIEWASFACILVSGAMVREIGPMDEGYFLYFEDAEYCLRGRRAGWSIIHEPRARAIHHRGGSGPVKTLAAAKRRMPAYFYASRSRFLYQAHGRIGLLAANLTWHLGRGLAQLRRLAGKGVPRAAEAEARDLWINAFDPLGPRRAPWEEAGE